MAQKYDLEERLLQYAVGIVAVVQTIERSYAGQHIAQQLLRSGTSPLANHGEAEAGKSRKDFVNKLRTCLQELREARRWLRLLERASLVQNVSDVQRLIKESEELIRIFFASIRTAESHADSNKTRE